MVLEVKSDNFYLLMTLPVFYPGLEAFTKLHRVFPTLLITQWRCMKLGAWWTALWLLVCVYLWEEGREDEDGGGWQIDYLPETNLD